MRRYKPCLRTDLLATVMKSRFGSIEGFAFSTGIVARASLYRWLARTAFPQNADDLLRLAAALDIDPLLLLDFDGQMLRLVRRRRFRKNDVELAGGLAFMRDFIDRPDEWPPIAVATRYPNRNWVTRTFSHTSGSRRNVYHAIELMPRRTNELRIWHFAYTCPNVPDYGWDHYGFVEVVRGHVRLNSFDGNTDEMRVTSDCDSVWVRTFFGEGNATFKVASLHPFDIRTAEEVPDRRAAVTFEIAVR